MPGYMGKRVYISYSNLFSISTLFYPLNETGPTHSFGLNFVTGKRSELSVSANFFASKVENDIQQYIDYSENQYNEKRFIFDGIYHTENMNSFGGSLALKVFRKDRFAPVGPYAKWEAIFYSNRLTIRPYHMSYFNYNTNNYVVSEYGGVKKLISVGGAFGFGKQKILKDGIIIDLGIRAAIVYTVNIDGGFTYYEQNVLYNVFTEMFSHEIINVRLGIGFLAF